MQLEIVVLRREIVKQDDRGIPLGEEVLQCQNLPTVPQWRLPEQETDWLFALKRP